MMDRRSFLGRGMLGAGALGLSAGGPTRAASLLLDRDSHIIPIRASIDRMFRVTVCLRPFRAAGPRIEAEEVGRKLVIHNYGHGGSGWSLSWGSAAVAVGKAMEVSPKEVAVIGAGAMGLTAALTAQRAGLAVTIYAKEQFPDVRSARATGTWSPDSRVAMEKDVDSGFGDRWESMARTSFAAFQGFLGSAGDPVEWTDRYALSDLSPVQRQAAPPEEATGFSRLEHRLHDITPRSQPLGPGEHPFPTAFAYRNSSLTFNVADLSRQLMSDFLIAGGKVVPMTFHEPNDIMKLKQKVIINCTGYGARALWKDESVIPVRGQIAWLIPQAGVTYGVYHKSLNILARRDGIVVQEVGENDWFGYNDANETPDRQAAETSVRQVAELFAPRPAAA
ncbi:FAD-dependent oxidoreductase [Sphingobium phenoxybenzoativorans]|uniref:D-amino-acid oxidase n=1 Tax=Sphingobium phenoxybenzoativorans TaxID=1592790 RepID=A0A975PZR1_9SPHN|nr:FAD-dependent oxidoreductase [Sphingobium phenoxybenzoativorans]QUT04089.1 FAD-dependent oxidoreductase [Sphingobium phenoxybenzoativorans]